MRSSSLVCLSIISIFRRQDEIVSPGLFEYSIDGKADQLYCLLEDGDSVDSKVSRVVSFLAEVVYNLF
jgi:hypothetical protein